MEAHYLMSKSEPIQPATPSPSPAVAQYVAPAHPAINVEQQRALATAALAAQLSTEPQDFQASEHYIQPTAPALVSESSNVSQESFRSNSTSPESVTRTQEQRPYTPEHQLYGVVQESFSPKSVGSPHVLQGAKRTASGAFKTAVNGELSLHPGIGRSNSSTQSSSRVAEISAQLKTRLAYAMLKVNHGWENHNLDELEHISQISTPSISSPSTTSPQRRRLSLHSEYTDRYITSPEIHTSPRIGFTPRFLQQPLYTQYPSHVTASSSSLPRGSNGPTLAPAAPIAAGRSSHRRSLSAKAPPALLNTRLVPSDPSSQPSTPQRRSVLRMPSQQAEKDALESLLFMSSPNNSGNLKHFDSPVGPGPLRTEFPPSAKRVVFEN